MEQKGGGNVRGGSAGESWGKEEALSECCSFPQRGPREHRKGEGGKRRGVGRKKQEKMLWKEMKQIGKALVITDDKCYELSFTHSKSLCWGSKTPVSLNLFGNGVVADVIS